MSHPSSRLRRPSSISESLKIEIAANSLHELNNKIATILFTCDLITLQAGPDSKVGGHSTVIRNAANQIAGIFANFLKN